MDPFAPIPEIRKLPDSLGNAASSLVGPQSDPAAAQPVKLTRPASGSGLIPVPPVTIDSTVVAKRIVAANPSRYTVILRNNSLVGNVAIAGGGGGLPSYVAGVAVGIELRPGEVITLETTGEVWAVMGSVAAVVSGVEILTNAQQQ